MGFLLRAGVKLNILVEGFTLNEYQLIFMQWVIAAGYHSGVQV